TDALDLLKHTSIGGNGTVYGHLDTEEHVKNLVNPTMISLRKNGSLLGMGVFCNLQVMVNQNPFNCFYVRYFSASPEIRGKGLMKKFGKQAMGLIREGQKQKTIFYASVEKNNISSVKVINEAGYKAIRKIKTIGFSRYFPKNSPNIRKVQDPMEKKTIMDMLKSFYSDYSLVQFTKIFHLGDYYYIEENGKIVAGCQIHRVHWVIKRMEGLKGKMMVRIIPFLPLLRNIFNPRKFKFLALEGVFFKEGKEAKLFELIEGLLAQNKVNAALIWLDEHCNIYRQLTKFGNLGLLNNFTRKTDTLLMASFVGMTDDEVAQTISNPVYISSFDFT
ncbi:MAG TPA: GNAT family N-acetyltransferase, partial [Bacteroidales bacterium]|nr:GNAT family N-acetyltransferase [Bacteroidales bacterium]